MEEYRWYSIILWEEVKAIIDNKVILCSSREDAEDEIDGKIASLARKVYREDLLSRYPHVQIRR